MLDKFHYLPYNKRISSKSETKKEEKAQQLKLVVRFLFCMTINIPCIDCIHFKECVARRICVKDLFCGRLTCYDHDTGNWEDLRSFHKNPLGMHLFNRPDGRFSLPRTEAELKSLNEDYRNALRPNILRLLQICEQLLQDE